MPPSHSRATPWAALAIGLGLVRGDEEDDEALRARVLDFIERAEKLPARPEKEAQPQTCTHGLGERTITQSQMPSRAATQHGSCPPRRGRPGQLGRTRPGSRDQWARRQNRLDRSFSEQAHPAGTSIEEFRAAALKKFAEGQVEIDTRPQLHVVRDEVDNRREAVTNALMHRVFPGRVELKREC